MNNKDTIKSSSFWYDYDGEPCIHMEILWAEKENIDMMYENIQAFLARYLQLCTKYQILLTIADQSGKDINEVRELLFEVKSIHFPDSRTDEWTLLNLLYQANGIYVFPSGLFVYENDNNHIILKKIIDVHELKDLNHLAEYNGYSVSGIPFRINFHKGLTIGIRLSIKSDAFFQKLDNPKVVSFKSYPVIYHVDNSMLAYLNTTRLNSFLRDLKILSFEYGASNIDIENLFEEGVFNEKGFLFDKEVIYYEDIYEMLPENYKIKEFENTQVELDDTNYRKYLNSKMNQNKLIGESNLKNRLL